MKLALMLAACAAAWPARAQDPPKPAATPPGGAQKETEVRHDVAVPATMTQAQARVVLDKALAFICSSQHPDGSWCGVGPDSVMELGYSPETYYDWTLGAIEVALLALMESDETPERRATLEKGMKWLCESRLPARGDGFDNDGIWPSLYGVVATVRAMRDPRFKSPEWQTAIGKRGKEYWAILELNQVPDGGWGYYDVERPFTQRPKWATSFATASVVPALKEAKQLGWITDPKIRQRAVDYVAGCALPSGAYEYDLNPIPRVHGGEHINNVKGSLGRIQICNWALRQSGVKFVTDEKIAEGLGFFFEEHRFLDAARMRPIPHEAYYANAGYFYDFGHYYCALAINCLPEAQREAWHAKLRPHLAKTQYDDGSTGDFLHSRYDVLASTGYMALALQAGLPAASQPTK